MFLSTFSKNDDKYNRLRFCNKRDQSFSSRKTPCKRMIFIILFSFLYFADDTVGDIINFTGKVTNDSDTPIKGAIISLKNTGLQTISDTEGLYVLTNASVNNKTNTKLPSKPLLEIKDNAVKFTIDKKVAVSMDIYNVCGSLVRKILSDKELIPGSYNFSIGQQNIVSGLYFVKLRIGDEIAIFKYSPFVFSSCNVLPNKNKQESFFKRMTLFEDTLICQKNGLQLQTFAVNAPTGIINFKLSPRTFMEFATNQNARTILNAPGFNNAGFLKTPGDGLLFNHPGNISIDGSYFTLADTRNNRVLIWNSLPAGNVSPDLVLGQPNLTANNSGTDLASMNWPTSVSIANKKIVVADAYNNRILIWNSLPKSNGQPADFAIVKNMPAANPNSGFSGSWPWSVWTDGTKLVVTATQASQVLIWNSFPGGDTLPDITLTGKDPNTGLPAFGTPRSISTDGTTYLMVSDHNSYPSLGGTSGSFFWNSFPTSDQAWNFMLHDYGLNNPTPNQMPVLIWGGQKFDNKFLALSPPVIGIWNNLPSRTDQLYNSFVGCGNGFDMDPPVQTAGYRFTPGDDGDLKVTSSGRVYISLNFENIVVGYNSLPISVGQSPDFVIGSQDINTNPLYNVHQYIDNPVPATNGKILIATSAIDRKIAIWNSIPTINSTTPDHMYDLGTRQLNVSTFHDSIFIAAGQDGTTPVIDMWTSMPPKSGSPDAVFSGNIGNVNFNSIGGVALDNKYFYVTDQNTQKVYIWSAMPAKNDNPLFTLNIPRPANISSDGTYFAVTYCNLPSEWGCKIYKVSDISNTINPVATLPPPGAGYAFSPPGPTSVLIANNHLFLSDATSGRILVWTSIDSAIALRNPDVVLGQPDLSVLPLTVGLSKNRLFWPAQMAFDGCWLWVGEFKFSGRLLAF